MSDVLPAANRQRRGIERAVGRPIGLLMLGGLLLAGGCSREARHRVLSTFFDGVPHPDSTAAAEAASVATASDTVMVASSAPEAPTAVLHPPFADGDCDLCHIIEGPRLGGTVTLQAPEPELCPECHDDMSADELHDRYPWVHGPVAAGACTGCHSPHRSIYEHLLLAKPGRPLCLRCHDGGRLASTAQHEGTGDQSCLACHAPHGADTRGWIALLQDPGDAGSAAVPTGDAP